MNCMFQNPDDVPEEVEEQNDQEDRGVAEQESEDLLEKVPLESPRQGQDDSRYSEEEHKQDDNQDDNHERDDTVRSPELSDSSSSSSSSSSGSESSDSEDESKKGTRS